MKKHLFFILLLAAIPLFTRANPLPFVKIYKAAGPSFNFPAYTVTISSAELRNEKTFLETSLQKRNIEETKGGIPVNLVIADIDLPLKHEKYKELIYKQGYSLELSPDKIVIKSPGAEGIFYGIQTLLQCLDSGSLDEAQIKDWPDLPIRMIMVDPARQNENISYYKRLIAFCGRYKINRIQIHLTDDQTSCLYNKDYPELMHPHALKKKDIRELVNFAAVYHIKLIPEIESFGHSRMFDRLPDAKDYLNQNSDTASHSPWNLTDMPGYTSTLCPASDKAMTYLREMYRKATLFGTDCIHIGFDEVDLSDCNRCKEKFGNLTGPQLFRKHMNHCISMAGHEFKKVGVWGDMILKHPEIADSLQRDNVIIYDWHYWPDVTSESVDFFQDRGFEVIACPALVCWPQIMFPDHNDYTNIRRFTQIAREKELLGVNTTIWVPMRYMSDVLWTGIAYAAVQSWGGSNWNEKGFYEEFAREFFGSDEGDYFMKIWHELTGISVHLDVFFKATWSDPESLKEAGILADSKKEVFIKTLDRLREIHKELPVFGKSVTSHALEWRVVEQTTAMRAYTLEHLLASTHIKTADGYNRDLIKQLDDSCVVMLDWIEKDWDRNRYADDPNKNGIYVPSDHLLYRFKKMHEYHQALLKDDVNKP